MPGNKSDDEALELFVRESFSNYDESIKRRAFKKLESVVKEFKREIEEDLEDEEISERYENRLELPDDQWIRVPKGKSLRDVYEERRTNDRK